MLSRRVIASAISVIFTSARKPWWRLFSGPDFKCGPIARFSPNVVCEFERDSHIEIGNRVRVHSGAILKARSGSMLFIGDDVSLNYGCIAICHEKIEIGKGTEIGPNVLIYDHDHVYRNGELIDGCFNTAPVIIGKGCWIGAGSIILRGTTIGDNSIIGAGSLLKGVYPSKSVVIQRRSTEIQVHDDGIDS